MSDRQPTNKVGNAVAFICTYIFLMLKDRGVLTLVLLCLHKSDLLFSTSAPLLDRARLSSDL